MADKPFRVRILEALTGHLQTIVRVANPSVDYAWSLAPDADFPAGRVLRGRSNYGRSDPIPMLAINEDPRNLEHIAAPWESGVSKSEWSLLIQGWVEDDPDHPTDPAHFLLADTRAKLIDLRSDRRNILGFGHKRPMIEDILVAQGTVQPPDDYSEKPYFWLPVTLCLVEDLADAFA